MQVDDLAILLAVGTEVHHIPRNRSAMLDIWNDKSPSQQVGYKLRAERLVDVWKKTGFEAEWDDQCA
jgi:hypothetical protein